MSKIIFFIPAGLFGLIYGTLLFTVGPYVSPFAFIWVALLIVGGVLLFKGKFWGGFIGMLPGFQFMYMSTVDTGQVVAAEMPIGLILVLYFALCSGFVYLKQKKISKQ